METLRMWLKLATKEERSALAAATGVSQTYLYCLAAAEDAPHRRNANAELASKIERACAQLNEARGRAGVMPLPVVLRTDLNKACRECEYAHRCLGDLAVASGFKIVTEDKNN